MITITTMRIVWLLRAETTTTTMLRLSSACVLRFTRSQNSVSFPVFAKLFAQTSICELIDLSMKGLTILPFIFFTKGETNSTFLQRIFLLWNELEKAVELFFIFLAKKLFCGDPIILWSDLIMTIFCHSERNAVQSKNLGLLLVY